MYSYNRQFFYPPPPQLSSDFAEAVCGETLLHFSQWVEDVSDINPTTPLHQLHRRRVYFQPEIEKTDHNK